MSGESRADTADPRVGAAADHRARLPGRAAVRATGRLECDRPGRQSVPVRCVEVDNADHLYLAGKTMIPTHNSTLGLDFARSASIKHGLTSVHLLAGDEPHRDHHATAVGRGEGPAAPHAQRQDERRGLGQAGPQDGRGLRGAAVHRRLAEPDDDGDPRQGPPAQAAPRPPADHHRLPPADDVGQEGRVPPARGLRVLPLRSSSWPRNSRSRSSPSRQLNRGSEQRTDKRPMPPTFANRDRWSRMPTW